MDHFKWLPCLLSTQMSLLSQRQPLSNPILLPHSPHPPGILYHLGFQPGVLLPLRRRLQLSQLEGHNCHLVSRGQGCCLTSYNAQDSSTTKSYLAPNTTVENPGSGTTLFLCSHNQNQNWWFRVILPYYIGAPWGLEFRIVLCSTPAPRGMPGTLDSQILSHLPLSWEPTVTWRCLVQQTGEPRKEVRFQNENNLLVSVYIMKLRDAHTFMYSQNYLHSRQWKIGSATF